MATTRPEFIPPEWYTGEGAEEIQARMMTALPADIDNIEGGFPYDFTMPTALEADELINFYLIETLKLMFPEWSYGRWLDYHARRVGIQRRAANPASGTVTITGVPGTAIPAGTILAVPAVGDTPAIEFSVDETYTIGDAPDGEDYGTVTVDVTAVVAGITGNVSADTVVIMASPFTGIVSLWNEESLTGGTAEEDDDSLYDRIHEAELATGDSFVGCDADYVRWAKEVPGVGSVMVDSQYEEEHPNWVRLIILDSNGEPANNNILEAVYDHIMGGGDRLQRLAPVGAILIVEAPKAAQLDIVITGLVLAEGVTKASVIEDFKDALEDYYIQAKAEGVVKWNRIHAIFTDTYGVSDFESLTVSGSTQNIPLGSEDYPVTKGVTAT